MIFVDWYGFFYVVVVELKMLSENGSYIVNLDYIVVLFCVV